MNPNDKYVVTDEDEIVEIFDSKEEALDYANELSRTNAIKEMQENQVDSDEIPEDDDIAEWIAFRGTVEVRQTTEEDKQEMESKD